MADQHALQFLATLERAHSAPSTAVQFVDPLTLKASQEAYRWARRDRRTEGFYPQPTSGNAAIMESHDLMHSRVRSEVLNNAQIKRIVQALTDLVVGTGVQTFAWPFLPWEAYELIKEIQSAKEGRLDPRLRYALESDDLYEEWFNTPAQIDIEGKRSGPEFQRDMMRECVQVGNGLLIRVTPGAGHMVPLAYQLIERDQLDTTKDRPVGDGNQIVNGIEINSSGRAVAYHVLDAHPGDSYCGGSRAGSARILAERVTDLSLLNRPSATIGATWLDAVGQKDFDRDSFIDAEIKTAAKGALLALIYKTENPHIATTLGLFDDDTDQTDSYGNEEVRLGTTPLACQVGVNEDVSMVESNRPTNTANAFFQLLDHDIAGGAGISYYTLTGDYSSTSYSSVRAAKLDEDMHIRPLQQWFGSTVALPMRKEFNQRAAAAGLFETLRPAEYRRNKRRYQRFDAIGCGRELLDPFAETEAAISRLRAGLSTLKIELARRGLHWIKVLMQQGLEGQLATLFNATIDWSKGGGVAETEIQQASGESKNATDKEEANADD